MTLDDLDEETGELAEMLVTNATVDPRTVRMRHSILKQMALSPAHLKNACQQPQDDSLASKFASCAVDKKEALRFGTACHEMLLGDPKKVTRCSMRRDMRTKAFQEYVAAAQADGVVAILSDREFAAADAITNAIKRNKVACTMLLDNTVREQKIEFDFCGRAFRATPDALLPGKRIVDLKTTRCAKPGVFDRDARRLFYPAQLALYDEATGGCEEHVIVAVERTPPFPCTTFVLSPAMLDLGRRQVRLWTEQLLVCEASGSWPEYASAPVLMDVDEERMEWAA